jgi:hypothetical protein
MLLLLAHSPPKPRSAGSILNQRAASPGSPLFLGEFRPRLDDVPVTCVLIAVTVSTLNAIDVAEIKTDAQQYNLTPGSAAKPGGSELGYGVGSIAVPPGRHVHCESLCPLRAKSRRFRAVQLF